jgi:two-component system, LuxR family, response regulator FixJ
MSGISSESTQQNQAEQQSSRRENRVIAVADDDTAVCDSMQILLEVHDFVVHTYQSGAAFLQDQPEKQPALSCLIVDYHMPGLNGLELVSEVRKRGISIPVIMITATSDARIETQAAQLGIKHVLKKTLGKALISAVQEELSEG